LQKNAVVLKMQTTMKNIVRVLGVLGLLVAASTACDDDSSGSGSDAGGGAIGTGAGSGGSGGSNVTGDAGPGGTDVAVGGTGGSVPGGSGGTAAGGTLGTPSVACGNASAPCSLTVGATFSGKGVGEGDGYFTFTAPESAIYTLTFTGPPSGNINFDRKLDGEWALFCEITGGVNAPCCTLAANGTTCDVFLQSADRTALMVGQQVRIHVYAPGGASYSIKISKKL
jgi:hypothetical protein